jgi:RNA polymerase-binding transcription factor DksA
MQTATYKKKLEEEETRLIASLGDVGADARNLSDASGVGDWSDASVEDEEKDRDFATAQGDSATLEQVRAALQRIEAGTFGKCLVDGGPIEEQRLKAIPWAPYCLKHEKLQEQENPRQMPTL